MVCPEIRQIGILFFMKNLYTILLSLLAVTLLGSCVKGDENYVVRFSENGVVFDAQGGTKSVEVTTLPKRVEWQAVATESNEWFSFEVQDNLIVVTVAPNTSESERTAQLSVSSANNLFPTRFIAICQEAGEAKTALMGAADSYEFDSRGGEKIFTVDASCDWDIEKNADWIEVEQNDHLMTIAVGEWEGSVERNAEVTLSNGNISKTIQIIQHTVEQNRYLNLVGKWEITATKWYYTTNGSLNEVGYTPAAEEYCLLFDIAEGEYGKTLIMKNFLYPGTSLEVKYDSQSGGFVVPFGWTVLSYDVFLYITGISGRQFFYASYEVDVTPVQEGASMEFNMPTISGCDYVGFGLWTYNDNDAKVAFGYSSHPTMYPMGDIKLVKKSI